MAFLTAEELFRMIVFQDPTRRWAKQFRELELEGRFSDEAQVLIYQMQKDEELRARIASNTGKDIQDLIAAGVRHFEFVPLLLVAVILGNQLKNSAKTFTLAVVSDRSEVRQRFSGHVYDPSLKRDEYVATVLKQIDKEDWGVVLQCPRFLLTLANLNFTEWISVYLALLFRREIEASPNKEHPTIHIPKSLMRVVEAPSLQSSRDALEFLLDFGPG